MPYYAVLASWTEEGIRTVQQSPQRSEALQRAVEAAGGRVLSFLHTMGPYDIVATLELPSDMVLNEIMLRSGMQGFVRTVTLKGWTGPEYAELVHRL